MCVPVAPDSFSCRLPLLEKWRGVRDAEVCGAIPWMLLLLLPPPPGQQLCGHHMRRDKPFVLPPTTSLLTTTRPLQLSELSGIPGCVFVHAGGFIGGNDTLVL